MKTKKETDAGPEPEPADAVEKQAPGERHLPKGSDVELIDGVPPL